MTVFYAGHQPVKYVVFSKSVKIHSRLNLVMYSEINPTSGDPYFCQLTV